MAKFLTKKGKFVTKNGKFVVLKPNQKPEDCDCCEKDEYVCYDDGVNPRECVKATGQEWEQEYTKYKSKEECDKNCPKCQADVDCSKGTIIFFYVANQEGTVFIEWGPYWFATYDEAIAAATAAVSNIPEAGFDLAGTTLNIDTGGKCCNGRCLPNCDCLEDFFGKCECGDAFDARGPWTKAGDFTSVLGERIVTCCPPGSTYVGTGPDDDVCQNEDGSIVTPEALNELVYCFKGECTPSSRPDIRNPLP
jgi:hypothetical protein